MATHDDDAQRGTPDNPRAMLSLLGVGAVLVIAALVLGFALLSREGGGDAVAGGDAGTTAQSTSTDQTAGDGDPVDPTTSDIAATEPQGADVEPCPAPSGSVPAPTTEPYDEPPSADLSGVETVDVVLSTTCGDVTLELDPAAAPTTVSNFVALAEDGYYDGVGFHRVIDGFMVQGGDPTGTGTGCVDEACQTRLPGYTFGDELGLAEEVVDESGGYPRGTVAMANSGADTNGSQFFIVQGTPGYPLPPEYAVFGEVASGMEVVDRIAQGPVDGQLAVDPVRILDVTVTG